MGSPVSVVVAEIIMQNIEEHAQATQSETLPLWPRSVDDMMTAAHEHLNKQNTSIRFAKDIEEKGKMPFLDCLVIRENDCPHTL